MSASKLASVVRWAARIWSVASLMFLSALIFGGDEGGTWPTAMEWIGLAFFPGGIIVGLLIAWWKEFLGGGIVVASLAGFYAWHFVDAGKFGAGPWFVLAAAPGFLFVLASAGELSLRPLRNRISSCAKRNECGSLYCRPDRIEC